MFKGDMLHNFCESLRRIIPTKTEANGEELLDKLISSQFKFSIGSFPYGRLDAVV